MHGRESTGCDSSTSLSLKADSSLTNKGVNFNPLYTLSVFLSFLYFLINVPFSFIRIVRDRFVLLSGVDFPAHGVIVPHIIAVSRC